MTNDEIENKLRRLITGLTDQEVVGGKSFKYDGANLHADDVADIMLSSVLCIAQDLSEKLGFGGFGYRFWVGSANPIFPLHACREDIPTHFFRVAPFVTEVFDAVVVANRADVAHVFDIAMKILDPSFEFRLRYRYTDSIAPLNKGDSIHAHPGNSL